MNIDKKYFLLAVFTALLIIYLEYPEPHIIIKKKNNNNNCLSNSCNKI